MSLPDEYSLECVKCGVYNLTEGEIINGKVYCLSCAKEKQKVVEKK